MYRQNYPGDPGMHNPLGDSHTRVTYRRNPNFCERISNSMVAFLVGVALLFIASGLLFWNEGRAVQTAQSLEEGLNIIVPLRTTEVAFDNNNGKLVHLSGFLNTKAPLVDPVYHISVHAAKLKRTVEMYQWVEHVSKREYNEGGHTREEKTYSYSLEWRSDLVRSASFDSTVGHENPTSMPVESITHVADGIKVGSFVLSSGLTDKISNFKEISPSNIPLGDPSLKIHLGAIYHSFDPSRPQPGDVRVKFHYAGLSGDNSPDRVSIIARQLGQKLLPYQTEAGDTLELLYPGDLSAQEIFNKEKMQNTFITWGIRFGGWLLMFIAFGCLTNIITTLVDWLPIVRELVGLGVGMLNLALSISLSLTVIAIGWIRYRPLLGLTLLALAASPMILSKFRPKSTDRDRRL